MNSNITKGLHVLSIYFVIGCITAVGINAERKKQDSDAVSLLDDLLTRTDRRVRPDAYGAPIKVECDFFVQGFGSINPSDMDYVVDIYFRERWMDKRLNFTSQTNPVILPSFLTDQLWLPDLFFPNEKKGELHTMTTPNRIITIHPDGMIRLSQRITLKLACPMMLSHFPMDYQDCDLKVSSYSYDTSQMVLDWHDNDPVELNEEELSLPQMTILGISHDKCSQSFKTGSFDCLQVTFHLKRLYGYFLLQAYIPSTLVVIISWVSFWVDHNAIPARITLTVTTMLTMATMLGTTKSVSASVSYPKALDVWMMFCMVLVFAALLEFAFVNSYSRREKTKAKLKEETQSLLRNDNIELGPMGHTNTSNSDSSPSHSDPVHSRNESRHSALKRQIFVTLRKHENKLTASGVDKWSRVLFPMVYICFNTVYWIVFLQPVIFFD